MKVSFKKYMLAAALVATTGGVMAQQLNSAYFSDSFNYRHDMNPAYDNEANYFALPILGNLGISSQGHLGVENLFFSNPDFGVKPGAKRTATFMHPAIPAADVLSGLNQGANILLEDVDIPILSMGFKGFNGYNTIELRSRTHVGLSLPYEFFEFAKDLKNRNYSFEDMGMRGWSYVELGFGHSRKVYDNLRVGAKVKLLFGLAYADVNMSDLSASLEGDKWTINGKAHADLNLKGATFKEKEKDYKVRPGKYRYINGLNTDGVGITGFGLGLDLGAVYEFKDCSWEFLNGLKASLALTDIGFISWSNGLVAESGGQPFEFDGFNNLAVKDESATATSPTFDGAADNYSDKLSDFANLQKKEEGASASHGLGATLRLGLEYPLPAYDKLKFGFLLTHRYDDQYGWSEGRFNANYAPAKWIDGSINLAFTTFCTNVGWMINLHPKGFNFFIGMDHWLGKTGKSMIPLDSNASFNVGVNFTWGSYKVADKRTTLKKLTF